MNAVDMYLKNHKTVLWGRSFDLMEPDSYKQAKQFIEQLWFDLEDIEHAVYMSEEQFE